jgi:hypothetical protein
MDSMTVDGAGKKKKKKKKILSKKGAHSREIIQNSNKTKTN